VGGVAWQALLAVGRYLVGHNLKHASEVYGFFAVVLGLLSWLYLGAQPALWPSRRSAGPSNRSRSPSPPNQNPAAQRVQAPQAPTVKSPSIALGLRVQAAPQINAYQSAVERMPSAL
jgi:hypothetical protein